MARLSEHKHLFAAPQSVVVAPGVVASYGNSRSTYYLSSAIESGMSLLTVYALVLLCGTWYMYLKLDD